ncbi:hypothetical protein [Chamaesiphon sp. GL140_3_metabinner_50]|nr:hypothetical protein [Chamaesiphon sp. GL140_3_metabinner_50]
MKLLVKLFSRQSSSNREFVTLSIAIDMAIREIPRVLCPVFDRLAPLPQ